MTGYDFPQMEYIVPPGERGIAKVIHQEMDELSCYATAWKYGMSSVDEPGSINVALQLRLGKEIVTMMSDATFERRSCAEVVARARGHVLIAGLGLGMILHPVCEKPGVQSVTVVERYRDVIELVGPTVAVYPKLRIVEADIFDWAPPPGAAYDAIWFDIWPNWGASILPQIFDLHARYRPFLAPGGWMDSWMRRESARKLRTAPRELRRGRKAIAQALFRMGIPLPNNARVSVGEIPEWA